MIESLCIAPVPCTPCVMSVVLFSVRVATSKSCMCMVTTAIHLACSVSSRHVCCGQCMCTWCVCSVPYSYKFFLQVDVSTRQNKECLTEQWHPCSINNWVHCTSYFLETTVPSSSFCRLTVCRLFLRIRTGNPWQNQMSATLVYYR